MIEAIITLLIYICIAAVVIYIVIWVLETVAGIALPPKVVQILWLIFFLICLLLLARLVLPIAAGRQTLGMLSNFLLRA